MLSLAIRDGVPINGRIRQRVDSGGQDIRDGHNHTRQRGIREVEDCGALRARSVPVLNLELTSGKVDQCHCGFSILDNWGATKRYSPLVTTLQVSSPSALVRQPPPART